MGHVVEQTEDDQRVVVFSDNGWRTYLVTDRGRVELVEEVSLDGDE